MSNIQLNYFITSNLAETSYSNTKTTLCYIYVLPQKTNICVPFDEDISTEWHSKQIINLTYLNDYSGNPLPQLQPTP